ncbi:hypothetical protein SAMN05518849_11777 [Sphingobium sp. AP50]|uniref:hypothetical protein n=1 Tax=Sphingobium sp. AP50 TaxID=1884369 RepID=UPI0008BA94BF|nr:hypothetical protein [Sphingobium sp. AP50]SEJ90296.1 hypothetical protein SAMN05518849_11777 [Sphingobium sp. AP50]
MRRLLPLFALIMLVLTGWSAMAHVVEEHGGKLADVDLVLHAPGDGDERPADNDSGVPHHHVSCHGHDLGASIVPADAQLHASVLTLHTGSQSRALLAADENVALRPPQA